MNPQLDKSPGLPFMSQPAIEQGQPAFNGGQSAYHGAEAFPTSPELPPEGAIPMQSLGLPAASIPTSAAPVARQYDTQASAHATGTDDSAGSDLDQEWIDKAKSIVEKTRNDPYLQSKEISKIKADYLRVRHNKHIKVTEEKAQ